MADFHDLSSYERTYQHNDQSPLKMQPLMHFLIFDCMCIFHNTGEAGNILSQMLEECICSMQSGEKCELNIELQTLQDTSL